MKQNKYYSYNHKKLPKGCQLCVKGEKTVLYITGICPKDCFYCPLSEQKKNKDVMYANEKKVSGVKQIIDEIKLNSSKGVGITGGDPLSKFKRTLDVIKKLKQEFRDFHIHLYTSLDLLSKEKLEKLEKAGLDEIRIHPDLYDDKKWGKIKLLKFFGKDKGIEIPAIPGCEKSIKNLISFSEKYVDFINLNEFEYSDTNNDKLHEKKFYCRSSNTYAIEKSRESALKLLKWCKKNHSKLNFHFCTAKLKDATQISNRLKKRSKNVTKKFDVVDEDGMIIRGVIKTNDEKFVAVLQKRYDIPKYLIEYDKERKQILIASWILIEICKEIEYECQIVTEYPTADRMIVEVDVI